MNCQSLESSLLILFCFFAYRLPIFWEGVSGGGKGLACVFGARLTTRNSQFATCWANEQWVVLVGVVGDIWECVS